MSLNTRESLVRVIASCLVNACRPGAKSDESRKELVAINNAIRGARRLGGVSDSLCILKAKAFLELLVQSTSYRNLRRYAEWREVALNTLALHGGLPADMIELIRADIANMPGVTVPEQDQREETAFARWLRLDEECRVIRKLAIEELLVLRRTVIAETSKSLAMLGYEEPRPRRRQPTSLTVAK